MNTGTLFLDHIDSSEPMAKVKVAPRERFYNLGAFLICAAATVLALILGHYHKVGFFDVETDFYGSYAVEAANIMEGRPYTFLTNPPTYILLLVFLGVFTGDFFVAGKILSAFSTGLFGWLTYLLLKKLFSARIALGTTFLVLTALVPHSFLAAMDMVGVVVFVLPLWFLLCKPKMKERDFFYGGMLAGVAYLLRYQYVFVVLGLGFCILFVGLGLNKESVWERVRRFFFFMSAAAITVSPWLICNWIMNGSPFASTTHIQIAANFYHPKGDYLATAIEQVRPHFNSFSDVFFFDPIRLLRSFTKTVLYTRLLRLATDAITFPANLFAGAGLLLLLKNLTKKRFIFLFVSLLGYVLMCLVGYYLRYNFFLFPLLFLTVVYPIFYKVRVKNLSGCHPSPYPLPSGKRDGVRGNSLRAGVVLNGLVFFLVAGVLCIHVFRETRYTFESEPRYLLEAEEILRGRSTSKDLIIACKPHLAYLSGLTRILPMWESVEEYISVAEKTGARFIAYSDFEARMWPGLKCFANPENVPTELKLIYRHEPSNTLIYEIVGKA